MISTTGLICQVFIGLKKEISDGRRADDQLIMKPFFSLLEGKSAFISEDGSESPPYPSKNTSRFFLKRFNHYFSCLCGTSGFLVLVGGKWTQLSRLPFGCGSISTSVTSHLYSGFVFVLILMRFILQLMALFFLNHNFGILMHYFVLSLKKNKHLILPHFHLDYFEAFSPLNTL